MESTNGLQMTSAQGNSSGVSELFFTSDAILVGTSNAVG